MIGTKSYGFGNNDLSKIRANGKKATQPCKCGFHGDKSGRCGCTNDQVQRYRGKISGPLLDRIDLHVEVGRPPRGILNGYGWKSEGSATVRDRVIAARKIQIERSGIPNAQMSNAQLHEACRLVPPLEGFLENVAEKKCLSPRACQRVLKVARTLADMDASKAIEEKHLAEAVVYRGLDR